MYDPLGNRFGTGPGVVPERGRGRSEAGVRPERVRSGSGGQCRGGPKLPGAEPQRPSAGIQNRRQGTRNTGHPEPTAGISCPGAAALMPGGGPVRSLVAATVVDDFAHVLLSPARQLSD